MCRLTFNLGIGTLLTSSRASFWFHLSPMSLPVSLLAATNIYRADPTGLIACPQPCNVRYAAAYSLFPHEVTRYAASWEFQGDNFSLILQYEFENQILAELGYSLRWR